MKNTGLPGEQTGCDSDSGIAWYVSRALGTVMKISTLWQDLFGLYQKTVPVVDFSYFNFIFHSGSSSLALQRFSLAKVPKKPPFTPIHKKFDYLFRTQSQVILKWIS